MTESSENLSFLKSQLEKIENNIQNLFSSKSDRENKLEKTIQKYKPKLALGVYHSIDAIYKIPLQLHSLCPEYKIFIRHNSWYIGETDVHAYV